MDTMQPMRNFKRCSIHQHIMYMALPPCGLLYLDMLIQPSHGNLDIFTLSRSHFDMQAEAKQDVATMISLQPALKFNGGGKAIPSH